jgi:hypothetical protein
VAGTEKQVSHGVRLASSHSPPADAGSELSLCHERLNRNPTKETHDPMPSPEALLRDIAATLESVTERIGQIEDGADLKGETWEALDKILSGARYLRRYR